MIDMNQVWKEDPNTKAAWYGCPICAQYFSSQEALNSHIASAHGGTEKPPTDKTDPGKTAKIYWGGTDPYSTNLKGGWSWQDLWKNIEQGQAYPNLPTPKLMSGGTQEPSGTWWNKGQWPTWESFLQEWNTNTPQYGQKVDTGLPPGVTEWKEDPPYGLPPGTGLPPGVTEGREDPPYGLPPGYDGGTPGEPEVERPINYPTEPFNWQDIINQLTGAGYNFDWQTIINLLTGQGYETGINVPGQVTPGGYDYNAYAPQDVGYEGFPYPPQYGMATDLLKYYGTAEPIQTPEVWNTGANMAMQMAQTGMPTQIPDAFKQASSLALQMAQTGQPTQIPEAFKQAGDLAYGMAQTGLPVQTPQAWLNALTQLQGISETGLGSTDNPAIWGAGEQGLTAMGETGLPTDLPSIWGAGEQGLTSMGATGMPVTSDEWWTGRKELAQQNIEDAIKEAAETAGLSGLRWSTPFARTAQDVSGRIMKEATTEWMDKELAAQEAARRRQMESYAQMLPYGQAQVDIIEAAKQRMMGSYAQMLPYGQAQVNSVEAAKQRMMEAYPQLYQLGAGQAQLGTQAAERQLAALPQLYNYAALPYQAAEAAATRQAEALPQLYNYSSLPYQAQEAAAQRQAAALPQLYQYGQGTTQLATDVLNRSFQAATPLMQLGQQYAQLPMDVAAQSQQFGLQNQAQQQAQYDKIYQEFMRLLPENSPWLQLANQLMGTPSTMTPTQYTPSTLSSLMSMLPLLFLL